MNAIDCVIGYFLSVVGDAGQEWGYRSAIAQLHPELLEEFEALCGAETDRIYDLYSLRPTYRRIT